jgi:hypothetical protein
MTVSVFSDGGLNYTVLRLIRLTTNLTVTTNNISHRMTAIRRRSFSDLTLSPTQKFQSSTRAPGLSPFATTHTHTDNAHRHNRDRARGRQSSRRSCRHTKMHIGRQTHTHTHTNTHTDTDRVILALQCAHKQLYLARSWTTGSPRTFERPHIQFGSGESKDQVHLPPLLLLTPVRGDDVVEVYLEHAVEPVSLMVIITFTVACCLAESLRQKKAGCEVTSLCRTWGSLSEALIRETHRCIDREAGETEI